MKFSRHKFLSALVVLLLSVQFVFAGDATLAEKLKNPIQVVLDDNTPGYNENIKYAVQNYWTASAYTFITKDEYKQLKTTDNSVFLMLVKDEGVDGGSTPYAQSVQLFYTVRNGSYRTNITGVPVIDVIAENSKNDLINAVRTLQDKLNFKIAQESENQFANFNDEVKTRTGIIKTKKLYLTQSQLDKSFASVNDIKSIYNGDVYIISDEEMSKVIDSKQNDAVYAAVSNFKNGIKYTNLKQVIDAQTGLVLYSDESKSAKVSGFTKADLENIQK